MRDQHHTSNVLFSTQTAATNINPAGEQVPNLQESSTYLQYVNNSFHQQANLITDKKLLELRAVALEYVKQIVAKASELSQERQKIKDAQKLTNYYNGTTTNYNSGKTTAYSKSTTTTTSNNRLPEPIDPAKEKAILREAASSINKRFQLVDNQEYFSADRKDSLRNRASSNPRIQATSNRENSSVDPSATADRYSNNSTSTSTSKRSTTNGSRRRRGLHQRLNWHLLVSCFSTCLPHSLVEAATRSATSATDPTGMGANRSGAPTSGV